MPDKLLNIPAFGRPFQKGGVEDPLKKTFQEKQRVRNFLRCAQVF